MAGLDHSAPLHEERRDPVVEAKNARLGLRLFFVYLVAYAAYVLINAFRPDWMDAVLLEGLNLAVLSGLGLIVGALALALIYAALCGTPGEDGA